MHWQIRIRVLFGFVLAICAVRQANCCTVVLVPHYALRDFIVEVYDWKGHPLAGVPVLLSPSKQQLNPGSEQVVVVANAKGIAEFRNVGVGDYDVTTQMANGENLFVSVVAAPSTQPVEAKLTLKWPVLDVLSVRTPSGRLHTDDVPLHLALTRAESGQELQTANVKGDGEFQFAGVSPGLYFIRVTRRSFEGDIAILIESHADKAKLDLNVGFSSCGLHYGDAQKCQSTERLEIPNVCGTVVDPTGAIIGDARVDLLSRERGSSRHATSNRNGAFVITGVVPGQYRLSVARPGFQTLDIPMQVLDGSGGSCLTPITVTLGLAGSCSKVDIAPQQ